MSVLLSDFLLDMLKTTFAFFRKYTPFLLAKYSFQYNIRSQSFLFPSYLVIRSKRLSAQPEIYEMPYGFQSCSFKKLLDQKYLFGWEGSRISAWLELVPSSTCAELRSLIHRSRASAGSIGSLESGSWLVKSSAASSARL